MLSVEPSPRIDGVMIMMERHALLILWRMDVVCRAIAED